MAHRHLDAEKPLTIRSRSTPRRCNADILRGLANQQAEGQPATSRAVHTMHQDILASVQSLEDLLHSTLECRHVKVLANLGPEANVPPDAMTPGHQTFIMEIGLGRLLTQSMEVGLGRLLTQ